MDNSVSLWLAGLAICAHSTWQLLEAAETLGQERKDETIKHVGAHLKTGLGSLELYIDI